MYNTDLPRRADLPSALRLWRSTLLAAASAAVLLVTIVLPAEYAVDPTGAGRLLGLTQMGEIKRQLAEENAAEGNAAQASADPAAEAFRVEVLARLERIEERLAAAAFAPQPEMAAADPLASAIAEAAAVDTWGPPVGENAMASSAPEAMPDVAPDGLRSDSVSFSLAPGQGAEIKLVMQAGDQVNFAWESTGGPVNFDLHGDGAGQSADYEKGRGVDGDDGVLEAAFDGNHGWFWRNRTDGDVTVSLVTEGIYADIKRVQ